MAGREEASALLRTEVARITAEAQAQLADLTVPRGASKTRRAEIQAARRAVWAQRQVRIDQVTAELRQQTRAARQAAAAARSARHRAASRAREIQRRTDRQVRRAEQPADQERALYRAQEQETTR